MKTEVHKLLDIPDTQAATFCGFRQQHIIKGGFFLCRLV